MLLRDFFGHNHPATRGGCRQRGLLLPLEPVRLLLLPWRRKYLLFFPVLAENFNLLLLQHPVWGLTLRIIFIPEGTAAKLLLLLGLVCGEGGIESP